MSSDPLADGSAPRVFISYAHDSQEHRDRVLGFALFLRSQGIEAVLDTWFTGDRQDWYAWAIREMTEADYVLVIASHRYRLVGDGFGPSDLHKGVQSEAALLRDLVYGDRGRWLPNVLPVILDGHGPDEIPLFLQPHTASHYEVSALTVTDAADLLRVILRQPAHVPPPVAARHPVLPPLGSRAVWGAVDALPAPLQGLLRAQGVMASELPYRLPGARKPSLASIYVRQELGSGTEAPQPEQPRTEPSRDGKVPVSLPEPPTVRLVVRPPSRTLRAALDDDDHLLVTGGPGQGKSTLSLRLAADIAEAWSASPDDGAAPLAEPVVPVRLTARDLAARRALPFAQALAEIIRTEYGALLRDQVDPGLIAERVSGCRWLLLIDGLDEVADAGHRDWLVRVLETWASDPAGSPYRILLTTRPIEGAALAPFQRAGAARYELQPFDEAASQSFAESWFADEGPDTAHRFIQQVRRTNLDELVRVPLLATIAAIIFAEHRDRPLPDNEYELYEAYLEYLRAARPSDAARYEEVRTPLLEHLGLVRLESDAPLMATALDWYAQQVAPERRSANWRDELMTFLTSVGPLMMRGEELRFRHHSFAEHLAATSMARQLPAELTEDHGSFVHLLHDARHEIRGRFPRAVLLHYTRLRPTQADRLVRSLHVGTPDDLLLVARLLAKHIPASVGVVDEVLATARAWATTNQYPSSAILHNITRATHHPGLVSWLVELSTDEKAPWPSRIVAAIALATRLDEGHADRAADLLQGVVHDVNLSVSYRLDAAEGLTKCGAARREAAQYGLRLLLTDPSTPAARRRAATVVLAGLGPDACAHAVESLLTMLDDPWSPVNHVVEATTALAEIGIEFHDRCATVFRSVLRTTREWSDIRNAARGLAALGPHYVPESADALIKFVGNRANRSYQRAQAAETLRELGPQFGMAAGELVRGMFAEPATEFYERSIYAYTLARLGSAYHTQAAANLKAMDESTRIRDFFHILVADGLIELGPEYHEEAAGGLRYAAEDPLSDGLTKSMALGRLAKLGQAHRAYASDRLRHQLCDQGLDLDTRIRAAHELVRLGPEFHREIENFLLKVVSQELLEYDQMPLACSTLANLGVEHHDLAARTLVAILRSPFSNSNSLDNAVAYLARLGPEYRTTASALLTAALTDPGWTDQQRMAAAEALAQLGGEYDRCVSDGLLNLLQQDGVDLSFGINWPALSSMGIGPRRELASALQTQMCDPHAGPERIVGLAKMIARFSNDHVAAAVNALEAVLADNTAQPRPRYDAASALAALRPDRRAGAVETITHWIEPVNIFWTLSAASSTLAKLGHDAVPMVQAVLADPHAERELRQTAAALLPELDPDTVGDAVTELRRQAQDEHLDDRTRSEIMMLLVEMDSTNLPDSITLHRQLLDDDQQPIPIRCHAAQQIVRLDRALWPEAVTLVRRLLSEPFATTSDRLSATQCLNQLNALAVDEKQHAARALVLDPALEPSKRRKAIDLLRGRVRLDAQRLQLADHRAKTAHRKPAAQRYNDPPPLRTETEEAIREVLNAPEFSQQDRIDAAVALADLTFRLIPETVEILTGIAESDTCARFAALTELASLDSPSRRTALRRAEVMIADESLPARHRRLAAETLIYIDYSAKPALRDFLRAAAADQTLAGICRVTTLHALRHIDGPEPLRALRDDVHLPLPVRMESAAKLVTFTADDRATATRILGQVAADREIRPALRLHATETLAKLGAAGRRQAIDALTHMLRDDTLPVTARDLSAWHLAKICPARRPDVIAVLHEIRTVANPLHRIAVLVTLGMLNPEEATPLLRATANDRALNPVARLRAAEKLADLRQDQCEAAALIARELMRDGNVPWHVRRHAACDLARWSLVCRQEARDMIIHIDTATREFMKGTSSSSLTSIDATLRGTPAHTRRPLNPEKN